MSRNGYSFRGRGGPEPPEKRQRVSTSDGPCVIYLGNVPKDWNEQIVRSVVAGSGEIVDIRVRIDPSGRSKNFVFVEYVDAQEALRGVDLLSKVTLGPNRKFRVELSKEGLRTQNRERQTLQLNRDHLPFYVNLPPQMLADGPPLSSQYQQHQQQQQQQQQYQQPQQQQDHGFNGSNTPVVSQPHLNQPKVEIPMPEVLAKASQYLPAYNADAFMMEDKISQNLQLLSPPQIIELIGTLKGLISMNPNMAQQAFNVSPNIPIATAQALLLMGLIEPSVITQAFQATAMSQPTITSTQPQPTTQPDPRWPTLPGHIGAKLAQLPPNEAATIAQVLQLTPEVVKGLPHDQRQLVENIQRQYL